MPISTINTNSIADDAVTVPKVTDQVLTHRNLIINGAMQVAQRGTSGTLVGGPGYVSLDRWRFYVDTSTTLTISQQSFSPGQTSVDKNLEYFMRFDWLGTGANQTKTMSQRIEGVNWGQGQPMTLSFYGLSQQADDVTIKVIQNFGSGGSASVIAEESVIDLTTSWNRYSLTFDMPSIAGKTVGTSPYIIVEFNFGPATLDSYFDITGVQLEVGDTATPFEHRSYGEEFAKCQRYYEYGRIVQIDTNVITGSFVVLKRAAPTMTRLGNTWTASEGGTFGPFDNSAYYVSTGGVGYVGGQWSADAEL